MITIGEYYFFNKIKEKCRIIFDVGTRDDIHYISLKSDIEFHLFEPNIEFYMALDKNLMPYKENKKIFSNNFGLGYKTETITYYHNTQSFTKLITNHLSNSNHTSNFKVVSFKEYIIENNIEFIDFLKIDTEGYEIDVIYSDIEYLEKFVKYIQFEYTSAWLSHDKKLLIRDIYNRLSNTFDFYILKDDAHPISLLYPKDMTEVTEDLFNIIDSYMTDGYGFNIALIQKIIKYDNN
jgi:FkbM family methyltransferase